MAPNFLKNFLNANNKVLSMNRRNVEFVKELNKRRYFPLANDKLLAKEFFSQHNIPTSPVLKVVSNLFEVPEVFEDSTLTDFVAKPARGSQGSGIVIATGKTTDGYLKPNGHILTRKKFEYELASILFGKYSLGRPDKVIIEKRLIPSDEFKDISIEGLFDIRIIVVKGVPAAAMLRLPTKSSGGKANLHQGGIGTGVDLETGKTTFAFHLGKSIEKHPDTDGPLLDFQIPHWANIIHISRLIGKNSPLQYIGADLTIDKETGPSVLEFNARPGLGIQNANQKGLQELIQEAFLRETR